MDGVELDEVGRGNIEGRIYLITRVFSIPGKCTDGGHGVGVGSGFLVITSASNCHLCCCCWSVIRK